jgi:hypothetical protein
MYRAFWIRWYHHCIIGWFNRCVGSDGIVDVQTTRLSQNTSVGGGYSSDVITYLTFDVNMRTSNLWVALYSNYQQFLYDPVSDFRGLNSLFGETAGVSCTPPTDRLPVG